MPCLKPPPTDRPRQLRKLLDGLTLQLRRAPFHAMADVTTLAMSDMFDSDLVELYVLMEGRLSVMSQCPSQDQGEFPSCDSAPAGGLLSNIIRTREGVVLKQNTDVYPSRGYQSAMVVPWVQQGAVEGLLMVFRRRAGAYGPGDLQWLELVAAVTNTMSLATKVSSEVRKERRSSVVPEYVMKSSLQLQHYQPSRRQEPLQDTRILE